MMTSSGRLRLDLDALASSAAHVTGQGEELATAHLSSDNRIVAANSGWVGSSARAQREDGDVVRGLAQAGHPGR
jgi:hypothetical protein